MTMGGRESGRDEGGTWGTNRDARRADAERNEETCSQPTRVSTLSSQRIQGDGCAPDSAPAQICSRMRRISFLRSVASSFSTTSSPSAGLSCSSDSTRPSRTEMMMAASIVSRSVCEEERRAEVTGQRGACSLEVQREQRRTMMKIGTLDRGRSGDGEGELKRGSGSVQARTAASAAGRETRAHLKTLPMARVSVRLRGLPRTKPSNQLTVPFALSGHRGETGRSASWSRSPVPRSKRRARRHAEDSLPRGYGLGNWVDGTERKGKRARARPREGGQRAAKKGQRSQGGERRRSSRAFSSSGRRLSRELN